MIRKAKINEVDIILDIYASARKFMRETGNLKQWNNNYPSMDIVKADIESENLYVITDNECLNGVFMLAKGPDPTYLVIDGKWNNDNDYFVIHRIASAGNKKGILFEALDFALKFSDDIRIDTHEDNQPMHHQLKKAGFVKCGTIKLANGDPRIAYHYTKR